MRNILALTLLTITALCIAAPSISAANINDEGAARLKSLFTKIIKEQQASILIDNTISLQTIGDITVEKADGYYAVTLPHISIKDTDGSQMDFGIVSINAAPNSENGKDIDGQWKMTYSIPSPIRNIKADGTEISNITIGSQSAAGIYHEKAQQFSKLDAQYKNISLNNPNMPNVATIENAIIRFDFDIDSNNRWSGPGYFEFKNAKINDPKKNVDMSLGLLKASFDMDQYDPIAAIKHKETILGLLTPNSNTSNTLPISKDTSAAIAASTLELLTTGINGMNVAYNINDIKFSDRTKNKSFALQSAAIALNFDGLLSGNNMSLGTSFNYDGADISALPAEEKDVFPTKMNFDIQINKIPFKNLARVFQQIMPPAGSNQNTQQALKTGGIMAMIKIPALLSQAGTHIKIKDNHVGNDTYNVTLNAQAIADIAAANSATAKANLVFKGLDALMKKIDGLSANAKPEIVKKATQTKAQLTTLKNIGQKSGDSDLYNFNFTLDADGVMLLNGQNPLQIGKGTKPQ